MIASLSPRTASTSRFSQVLSWGGVIIAFFGALVISWGEVSSVQAPGFLGNQWIFRDGIFTTRDSTWDPYEVGEAKHKSRIIEAAFVVTSFGKDHDACHRATADFGPLSIVVPGSAGTYLCLCILVWSLCEDRDLGLHDGPCLGRQAFIPTIRIDRPKHRNSATYCRHSYFKRRDFEIS